MGALNLVATAISALIPTYRRVASSGAVQRVTEAELSAGRFVEGATIFVVGSEGEFSLLVRQVDAETAIDKLVADYVGASFAGARPAGRNDVRTR